MKKQLNILFLLSLIFFIVNANKDTEKQETNAITVKIPRSESEEFENYFENNYSQYEEKINQMRKQSPKQSAAISLVLGKQGIGYPKTPKKWENPPQK
jgi:predicted 3-demethylubiquinone-9 3-methyltransferase (glyoxalase superfamily)